MRHQRKTVKLGRSQAHRDSMLANQVCSLIEHHRIKTTLAKAKAVRPLAEKMVTIGRKNTLHARRTALARLCHNQDAVKRLFDEVAPRTGTREGGYTRIIKLGQRKSDAAPMAFIEWVDGVTVEPEVVEPTRAKKTPRAKAVPGSEAKPKSEGSKKTEPDAKAKPARKKKAADKSSE